MEGNCLACGRPDGPGHSCYEPIRPTVDPRDARITRLENALRFYADRLSYRSESGSLILLDGGAKARSALGKFSGDSNG